MKQIHLTLPDGSTLELPTGSTPADAAQAIGPRLASAAVAALVNDTIVDLNTPLSEDAAISILTPRDPDGHEVLLHSTAHLLAHAVKGLYPQAKIAIGPALEERFYYDIDLDEPVSDDHLAAIEAEMKRLSEADYPVSRQDLSRDEALAVFTERGEDYKIEIISAIDAGDTISVYSQDSFIDLCRGPHVPSTGKIRHFKLLNTSGAHWRGDERNPMLQRIYGTSWGSKKELKEYLHRQEEARKRDHRKLGKELDLFSFHPMAPGSPFFHPKGATIYNELVAYIRSLYYKYDYKEIITPEIFSIDLWKQSGHWDHYREHMFLITGDEDESHWKGVKPMNCPGHTIFYRSQHHSYRDLPLRLADFGRLHRFEKTGVLSGLTRVRSFIQDDAHIFCTPDQIGSELEGLFAMVQEIFDVFGFEDMEIALSTRPGKALGDPELWEHAEKILEDSLKNTGKNFTIEAGEGAFYGPKIDYFFRDALRRRWQLSTIQLDFSLPERLGLSYIDDRSQEQQPVMIHRAILGSLERFIGVYLEHTAGDFPLWLAPVQAVVLPVSEKSLEYGQQVAGLLKEAEIRVEIDRRDEKIGAKIRQAEIQKVPVMLVVGEREAEEKKVALRRRHEGDLGARTVPDLIGSLRDEIDNRRRSVTHSKK